jgi:crotonobetaine/carnitine-CoA ligase
VAPHDKSRDLVFHYLLERRARETPHKPCLIMRERMLTYADVEAEANRWAHGFSSRGIRKGDRVLVMIPSGIEHVLVWLGLCKIGALMVPVNEAYKGNMLKHQVNDSEAELAVVAQAHLPHWYDLREQIPALKAIAVFPDLGTDNREPAPWEVFAARELHHEDSSAVVAMVEYYDPMAIFYTSGTTGPSKGVLYSYAQAHATAAMTASLCDPDDVFYMFLPMFHVGLSNMFGIVVIAGATMAVRERFSTREFWPDVRRYRVTMTILLSTMPNFLMSQPPSPDDADHSLRKLIIIPLPQDLAAFKARFGGEVATFYNMTEASMPLRSDGFRLANGTSCGRLRAGVAARIVDENDEPVSPGAVGELLLRSDNPWEFSLGYWRNPEKTAESWRNQWLHTGDGFRTDEDGNYYFMDRLKDVIRRRGENISSYEVEAEVDCHPAVLESAAVAVPSPDGEDEIKLVLSLRPGAVLAPPDLHGFLRGRLPAYMVPGFIEIRHDELPKTPTGKIRKAALREEGTARAWVYEQRRPTTKR